jgi:hypothetical protein
MNSLFKNIDRYLPLKAEFLEVDDYFISFGADTWNFYSDANWRIIKEKKVIMTDDDFDTAILKKIILSESIKSIYPLTNLMIEPVFTIGSDYIFEIFSKKQTESWKLSLPDFIYVQ